MEQRIGPTSPPVHAAGTDPAAIPGLTTPSAPEPAAADPEPQAAVEAPEEPEATTDAAAEEPAQSEPADVEADDLKADEADTEDADAADGEPAPDGPSFRVSDRRAAIAADHTGITFRLDTEEAEFSWDEIRAVAIDTPRFGRRFAVTVYTGPRRWFENDVEAKSKSLLKEWTARLDAVLDRYFEDGGEKDDSAEDAKGSKDAEESAVSADSGAEAAEKSEA